MSRVFKIELISTEKNFLKTVPGPLRVALHHVKAIVTCLCLKSIKSFLFDVGLISSKMCGFNHIFYMKHKLEDCHANLLRNRRQHHVHGDRQGRLCP